MATALIFSFCCTATDVGDGGDGTGSVAVVVAAVLDDKHSAGPSLGSFHCRFPSAMPLQTSFWLTILPLRTKATTGGS